MVHSRHYRHTKKDLTSLFNSRYYPHMTTEPEFTIPVSIRETDESLAGWPYRKPVSQPGPTMAERILGRPIDSDNRRHDEREIRSIYNRMGGGDE